MNRTRLVVTRLMQMLVLSPICLAQTTSNNGTTFSGSSSFEVSSLVISHDGKPVVTISTIDGSVKYGEGFKADSAAKEFWEQVSKAYPSVCVPRKPR